MKITLKSYMPVLWQHSTKQWQTSARLWNSCSRVCKLCDSGAAFPAVPPTESWHLIIICAMKVALLQNILAFQGSFPYALVLLPLPSLPRPPEGRPPPIQAEETGVLSPSRSTSTANLPGRWQPECDKSICPGLNLYANLK